MKEMLFMGQSGSLRLGHLSIWSAISSRLIIVILGEIRLYALDLDALLGLAGVGANEIVVAVGKEPVVFHEAHQFVFELDLFREELDPFVAGLFVLSQRRG